jgi:hypothetical protein
MWAAAAAGARRLHGQHFESASAGISTKERLQRGRVWQPWPAANTGIRWHRAACLVEAQPIDHSLGRRCIAVPLREASLAVTTGRAIERDDVADHRARLSTGELQWWCWPKHSRWCACTTVARIGPLTHHTTDGRAIGGTGAGRRPGLCRPAGRVRRGGQEGRRGTPGAGSAVGGAVGLRW